MESEHIPPEPGGPSDHTTLVGVLAALAAEGFDQDMFVTAEAMVRCGSCRHDMDPAGLVLDALRRIEGASDPSDMAAVLGITCPGCGAKGTAVVRYGPEAGPQDGAVLLALVDQRFGEG